MKNKGGRPKVKNPKIKKLLKFNQAQERLHFSNVKKAIKLAEK